MGGQGCSKVVGSKKARAWFQVRLRRDIAPIIVFTIIGVENERLASKRVMVIDYPDGRIKIRYEGRNLEYREFDKLTQTHQGEVVSHKRLGAMLNLMGQQQRLLPQEKRSLKCPTRRYPAPARLT
jgi:hypothetical protein